MNEKLLALLFVYFFFGIFWIPAILLKKTEPKNKYESPHDIILENSYIKYQIFFMIFNFLCFLFLNKIREHRKVDYYKNLIYRFDFIGFENLTEDKKLDYIQMSRYVKIKKIK